MSWIERFADGAFCSSRPDTLVLRPLLSGWNTCVSALAVTVMPSSVVESIAPVARSSLVSSASLR